MRVLLIQANLMHYNLFLHFESNQGDFKIDMRYIYNIRDASGVQAFYFLENTKIIMLFCENLSLNTFFWNLW